LLGIIQEILAATIPEVSYEYQPEQGSILSVELGFRHTQLLEDLHTLEFMLRIMSVIILVSLPEIETPTIPEKETVII